MPETLIALHGFLGTPKDWEFLENNFPTYRQHHLNLLDKKIFNPQKGLKEAGSITNSIVKNLPGEKILIGYSLGGRLALQALIAEPSFWKGAVIISTHPGLKTNHEKELRYQQDSYWSDRFRVEPWEEVIADWNAQAVFSGTHPIRKEADYSRDVLAEALKGWSLSRQDDLSAYINKLNLPILWVTGQKDHKFTAIAKNVHLSDSLSKHCTIPSATHRVPWEQEKVFVNKLRHFFETINERSKV